MSSRGGVFFFLLTFTVGVKLSPPQRFQGPTINKILKYFYFLLKCSLYVRNKNQLKNIYNDENVSLDFDPSYTFINNNFISHQKMK